MTNKVDTFINCLVQTAQAQLKDTLNYLLENGPSIHVIDKNRQNAAMKLAMAGNKEACLFLAGHGANLEDCVVGSFLRGDTDLYIFFVEEMTKKGLAVNLNRLANAAAHANNNKMLPNILERIQENKRDYKRLAEFAALGGHGALANEMMNKLEQSKRNYHNLAFNAATGGHVRLTWEFLSKMPVDQRDFDMYANGAAFFGDQTFVDDLMNESTTKDWNAPAKGAAAGGNVDLLKYCLSKMPLNKQDLNGIAACAAKKGYELIAEYCLDQIVDPNLRDFNGAAIAAMKGDHNIIAHRLLKKYERNSRNYHVVATEISKQTLTDLISEPALLTEVNPPSNPQPEQVIQKRKRKRRDPLEIAMVEGKKLRENLLLQLEEFSLIKNPNDDKTKEKDASNIKGTALVYSAGKSRVKKKNVQAEKMKTVKEKGVQKKLGA